MTESHPPSLYKYLDADAAVGVLESASLRWSAPSVFDDPFELDAGATLDFDRAALERTAGKAIANAVLSRQAPPGLPGHPMTNVIRRWRAQRRFTAEEEVLAALRTVLAGMVERRMEELVTVLEDWRAFATGIRILCLSERHNDLTLWMRQADRHRGVVLKLSCEPGSCFAAARPVTYQQRRPQITTLAEQVEVLIGRARHQPQEHFRDRLLTKSRSDAEEREWRCFRDSAADAAGATCEEVAFDAADLQAVYLGARMPVEARERVTALVGDRHPAARVLQASLPTRDFGIEFQPLPGSEDTTPETAEETATPAAASA